MKRRLRVILLLLAVFAAACSSSSTGSDVSTTQQSDTSTETDTDAGSTGDTDTDSGSASDSGSSDEPAVDGGAVEAGATSMAASSPIGAFFADDGGFEAAIAEYTIQVEEAILVCMAEQGFEFAVTGRNTNEVENRQNDLTLREWTAEFGFGISTSFDSVAQNQASNPNVTIFLSLGESEREVWAYTLNGVGTAALGGGGGPVDNNRPLEEQGCIGEALIKTGGQDAIEGLGDFGDIYEEGEEALFERREMVEVITAWSRCMSEAGFTNFAALEDPEDEVRDQFSVITAPIGAALDALSDEEGQALFTGESIDLDKLPGLDIDALRELQKYEVDLALVDLDCYEAEVQAVYEPLRNDFESGLLEEYADEFAAVKNLGS